MLWVELKQLRDAAKIADSEQHITSQNLPLLFFHSVFSGIASTMSQCSAIFPFSTRQRS
jgi:hypothetical protein